MQLRRKLKRLAAIALSLVMALSCMPVGVLAEAATPTDLIPENMATPDEAAPEEHPHEEITEGVPTEAEMEVVPEAPATEEIPSEVAPGGGDDAPLPEEQDASGTPTAPETPNKEESSADSRLPIQAALMNTAMCMYPLSDKPAYTARRIGSQNRWFTPRPRIFFLSWLRSFRLPHRSGSGFWTKPVKWSAAMYTQMIWIPAIC